MFYKPNDINGNIIHYNDIPINVNIYDVQVLQKYVTIPHWEYLYEMFSSSYTLYRYVKR